MKLYQLPMSNASFKVRALLSELGIDCELVSVDMSKGAHKAPEFLKMNPNGKIPVLEDNGFVVWESNAIICYLAALKPEKGLLPTDPKGMALVHQWLQWQATTLSGSVLDVMMQTVYARMLGRQKDEAKLAAGLEKVQRDLGTLEMGLGDKEYICGKLSIADFSLVSAIQPRAHMGFDLEAFPKVKAWTARMESRESVRKSIPEL
ncbi:MAG TPA: glutathione S-transferase family protein [Myxococcaceae bacterium]|nr:glutathione S-transferase family protein [Myxococcaceae bacterium]